MLPHDAVSGIYFAHLVRLDTNGDSHVVFVVRNDSSHSDLLLQTPDESWAAYNSYGGNSLYSGAVKASYNRPNNVRGAKYTRTWLFDDVYPMVRWLEANGYDVSYTTGVDSDRSGP